MTKDSLSRREFVELGAVVAGASLVGHRILAGAEPMSRASGSNAPSDDSAGGSCKGTRTSSDDCSTSRMISSFSEAGYQRRASHDQRDLERARVESAVSEIVAEWCAKCH